MALHRTIPDPKDPTKCVHVPLTPDEEAAQIAQWEAARAAKAARVPAEVTPAQMRLELAERGMLDAVEATVDQLGRAARIKWDYGITIPRGDPLITAAATALNLTDAQVDDLFRAAAQL